MFEINQTIDMETAKKALTQTEFAILSQLFNKVKDYEVEQMLKNTSPFVFGTPGTSKSKMIDEIAEKLGAKVIHIGDAKDLDDFLNKKQKPSVKDIIEQDLAFLENVHLMSQLFKLIMDGDIEKHDIKGNDIFIDEEENPETIQKVKELRKKNVPESVIFKLKIDAMKVNADFNLYVNEQERKAREAGVSLAMYVRQEMNK